jgi:hypothetical protein
MRMTKIGACRRALRALAVTAVAVTTLPSYADQADEIARLREEAAALRQSLDKLEARIQALENATPGARPPMASPHAAEKRPELSLVSVQQGWSEVRPGVSKERVDALLGKPERVMRINGDLVWYYVYPGLGPGSVFFNNDGKVTAAQAPRPGWF